MNLGTSNALKFQEVESMEIGAQYENIYNGIRFSIFQRLDDVLFIEFNENRKV